MKLNHKEDEYQKICGDYEVRINTLEDEKNHTEEKVNELIDIVKQQSKELGEFHVRSQVSEKEKKNILRNFEILEKDYQNCSITNEELKSQFSVISDFLKKINETESNMNKIHNELIFERENNNRLKEELASLISDIDKLKAKYSGENSPEYLRQVLESKDDEINNIK